jgi:alkanesulfonate monooxygenase SsuD/methylene tetrahydromethanopterin reductase-like flavin-dependent oxidoreductase (luciferase family)
MCQLSSGYRHIVFW